MRIVWSESGDGEWQGSWGPFSITIVYQTDERDEPWVWGVTRGDDGSVLAAGYEASLEAARREAERAIAGAVPPPLGATP